MHAFSAEENFLLINGLTNKTLIEMGSNTHRQLSPCSTFKIPLSLMGYDAGILENETNPTWEFQEGYEAFLTTWKNSHNPLSWMNTSCVWYSKILSLELGLKKIQTYLAFMGYGNQDTSTGLVDPGPQNPFWLRCSLKISLTEQVHFIQKVFCGQTPLSSHAIQMTKRLLFKENLPNGKLFGKRAMSCCAIEPDGKILDYSWFVGWVENDQEFYPFAYLIHEKKIDFSRLKELLTHALTIEQHDSL